MSSKRFPRTPDRWTQATALLTQVFGLDTFRPGQEDVIRAVLAGRNVLAVMPTGAGKSLCYQIPALVLPGTTVVVSPLIALMKDQVEKLDEFGLEARQVNSSLGARETHEALAHIEEQRSEFVLTTPERLATPEFQERLRGNTIDLLVLDEAHCLSQWGHDFRPAYLELRAVRAALGDPPVLALTATATAEVIEDIARELAIEDFHIVNTGTYRPNLHYEVRVCEDEDIRLRELDAILSTTNGSRIVYTQTVKQAQTVHARLASQLGASAGVYHGRMTAKMRRQTHDAFMQGTLTVLAATNAFGMGIDKPDIRAIIHYGIPPSLDGYYQESGRAGRDGGAARCVLLYNRADKRVPLFFMRGRYPTEPDLAAVLTALPTAPADIQTFSELQGRVPDVPPGRLRTVLAALEQAGAARRRAAGAIAIDRPACDRLDPRQLAERYRQRADSDQRKLERMIIYAQTARCRWRTLLEYFGESQLPDQCGHCDNCLRAAGGAD